MRIGVDVPYFADPGEIRAYAQAAEELGYAHLGYSEHVALSRRTKMPPGFSFEDPWHEAFTQSAFLAGVTSRVELCPSLLLLTLRAPVLAAKQAAEVDLLSGGRLRLAVGMGWNADEVTALGVDPATRGARLEEQVAVLRRLWTESAVSHAGRFFTLDEVGIHPRPERPIPIWMGGGSIARPRDDEDFATPSERVLDRIARLADGFKMLAPLSLGRDRARAVVERLHSLLERHGRDPGSFGIEARIVLQHTTPDEWPELVESWRADGATHLGASNRLAGGTAEDQIVLIARFAEAVGLAG
jgi:probable F420-dependent oxidoreductase